MDFHSGYNSIETILSPLLLQTTVNVQGITFLVAIIIFLLVISYFLAGSLVAFFSLTDKDVNVLKTKQGEGWKRIVTLLREPKVLHASLRIANLTVNVAIIILSNFLINQLLTVNNSWWFVDFLVKILIVTFFLVLFGEILPKVYASQNNLRFARDASFLVEIVYLLFRRTGMAMAGFADGVENSIGRKSRSYDLDELENDSSSTEEEKNILKGIAKFGNITVKQIMRTRLDVTGVDNSLSFKELIKRVEEQHYSRLPVYRGSLDDVVGMIQTKDLVPHLDESDAYDWHPLIRPPYFVHQHKLIEDLLTEFQAKHVHFAVVVDEFGGTSGIVTLEDIMEEIIGDIKDEFDDEESGNGKIDDFNYMFEGKTMINDVCKAMHLPVQTFDSVRGDSDSLGGLILELAGYIPPQNEVIKAGDFHFTILEADKNRILKVKVTIVQ
ncbi:gliding motility-associated protein GldE [Pinibacter soli]|uniref:Gliding motility-associated protein GldE n=1 Tax=Pinibacter soli TaxID=3044211 RepID=A0ABT6R8L2_9BACT|nr:gliding motility-associated protein GldE [Pinibacter soli]MDI3318905.1 gliding motility-associated protein GldE [Pinibacter soli]